MILYTMDINNISTIVRWVFHWELEMKNIWVFLYTWTDQGLEHLGILKITYGGKYRTGRKKMLSKVGKRF